MREKSSRDRIIRKQATPYWLSKMHKIEIEDIYWCAREMERILGEKFHVDHIVPINGKNVCGLHVPWNLQILTVEENLKKGNKLIENDRK